jgi:nicotinate-nucleotide adenylyltransferase
LVVDDRELRRAGKSYTVLTLQELRGEFPGSPILVLLGADAFRGLPSWHRWHELFNLAHFVVVERPGVNLEVGLPEPLLAIWRDKRVEDPGILISRRAGAIFVQPIVPVDISATLIRDRVAREGNAGTKWRGLLPPAVLAYIERHHLYLRGSDAP